MGRGRRKRKVRQITSSDHDSDSSVSLKTTTKIIPAPPPVAFKKISSNIQNCDIDSCPSTSSKLLKRNVPAPSIKLNEVEKFQRKKVTVERNRSSSKYSHANLTELKQVVQAAKKTATSKMRRPEALASLNKTVESSLKPMSSSTSSSTSFNSLLINSSINCDKGAVQERMTLSSNVQSLMPDAISADCSLIIDDPTLTQDLMSTEVSNCIYSGDTMQCSSSASNYNDLLKLPSDSYTHTLFKEQLHDKNIGNILLRHDCKMKVCF